VVAASFDDSLSIFQIHGGEPFREIIMSLITRSKFAYLFVAPCKAAVPKLGDPFVPLDYGVV
jgi:hypothetical protein